MRSGTEMKAIRFLLRVILPIVFAVAGCATYPVNPPLDHGPLPDPYDFNQLAKRDPDIGQTVVILAFSGGGTRAAAMAYGVLEALNDESLDNGRSCLLDKVKIITSVSGGSFASAYYGLYGREKFLRDFKREMLYRKIRSDLLKETLSPVNWPKIWSPLFTRSDLASQYYDRNLFHGATFADLPRHWPLIVINATDYSTGQQFLFTQDFFNVLCSDLNRVKIARAVTASSAFPGAFPPLTFKNYPKVGCGPNMERVRRLQGQTWFRRNPYLMQLIERVMSYQDAKERPFIHVEDGGVADNIGLRSVIPAIISSTWKVADSDRKDSPVRRVAVIIVDARQPLDLSLDKHEKPPGLIHDLVSAGTKPLDNYSQDSVYSLQSYFRVMETFEENFYLLRDECRKGAKAWCRRRRNHKQCIASYVDECTSRYQTILKRLPPYTKFYLVHVRFDTMKAVDGSTRLNRIPTDLQLDRRDVDLIIDSTKAHLENLPEYKRFIHDLRH